GNNDAVGTTITVNGNLYGGVIITGGSNDDTFNLNIQSDTGYTNVLGGDGNDTFNVNPDHMYANNGLGSALLTLDGQNGSDNYNINIWGNGNSHIVAIDHGT